MTVIVVSKWADSEVYQIVSDRLKKYGLLENIEEKYMVKIQEYQENNDYKVVAQWYTDNPDFQERETVKFCNWDHFTPARIRNILKEIEGKYTKPDALVLYTTQEYIFDDGTMGCDEIERVEIP